MSILRPFHPRAFVIENAATLAKLRALLEAAWEQRAAAGQPLEVVVAEWKAKRTTVQNAHYWAILREVSDQVWMPDPRMIKRQYDTECWHEFYARKFLGLVDLPGGGRRAISTTTLSVEEFDAYRRQVEAHAAQELGVQFNEGR